MALQGDAPLRPTFGRGEEQRYGERPILLMTHQRVRQKPSLAKRLQFEGRPRDLVVYDESLTTTEICQVSYPQLSGQLQEVWAASSCREQVATQLRKLQRALDDEVERQRADAPPALVEVPFNDALTARAVLDEIEASLKPGPGHQGGRESELYRFIDHGPHPARLILLGEARRDATVIRYEVVVPDELDRMVVLDASYPARRLLRMAAHRLMARGEVRPLIPLSRLRRGEEVAPVKHYDQVTIHLMETKGSGRGAAIKDLRKGPEESAILAEVVEVVKTLPAEEALIIWAFKQSDASLPNFERHVMEALERQGIDTRATIEVGGEAKPRITIKTFGQETASNAFKHCTQVIFMGCLEPSRQQIAGQLVGETRDLLTTVSVEHVDELVRGEVYHRVYQAISRAACREVTVDDQGRTQAKPTQVWLMTRHRSLKQDLAEILPGAQWVPSAPSRPPLTPPYHPRHK